LTPAEPQADLHTHTTCSDGTLSPEALVDEAKAAGLAAVAITDHDTVAGIAAGQAHGRRVGVEVVAGVEMSANDGQGGSDIHIVGLFIDPEHPEMLEALDMLRHERETRLGRMVAKLNELGVPVAEQEVYQHAGPAAPGRVHVAQAIVQRGAAPTIDDAFRRYISDRGPAYVAKEKLPPERAVGLIHAAGGVSVFAHPGATREDHRLEALVAHGLMGLEVFCPSHKLSATERYGALAARHGLLVSGGSDFHGAVKPDVPLGAATVPMRYVEQIRAAARTSAAAPGPAGK